MRKGLVLAVLLLAVGTLLAHAQGEPPAQAGPSGESISESAPPVRPPASVDVYDAPNDHGNNITVVWEVSPDDGPPGSPVTGYDVLRSESPDGDFESVAVIVGGATSYTDNSVRDGVEYYYQVLALAEAGTSKPVQAGPVSASQQWFDRSRVNLLVISLLLIAAIIIYIYLSTTRELYIRKIAGLEAVNEAVGRATEMGRSILFVPGIQDMDNVQTVAGVAILGHIAQRTANYETDLNVPVSRSIVMSVGRETVKQAYLEAGRPDLYNDDMVHYITDEQFGYVAAVDGIMVREHPAACFYLGAFFAESLILAETGNSIGAIQVAGTAMPTQLPFFVAACDYTLIGEELFAASAYLSKDRKMLGSLKGQDAGKAIAMVAILLGVGLGTLGTLTGSAGLTAAYDWLRRLFSLNF
ncbi:MAG: fibronectin type III domain-containing protein [bacterium]|jgi:hypothetical protein